MEDKVILQGSEKFQSAAADLSEPVKNTEETINLVLRRAYDNQIGSSAEDVEVVKAFANEQGLKVESVHAGSRTVKISGPLHDLMGAFGVNDLNVAAADGKKYRSRSGSIYLHPSLNGIVTGVFGFDTRPVAKSHHRRALDAGPGKKSVSYTPAQVAKAYEFPAGTGSGQTVALIELGGGYNDSDLASYWSLVGVSLVSVSSISVGSASNSPTGDPNSADGEVCLDIEVVGGIAPGATIQVYFSDNTDQGFLDGINAAIHATPKPTVISISWGGPESSWTVQAMNAFNAAFHDAALLGIPVCVAAGDNGSDDGVGDGGKHADFPGSSPWVICCGGTRLELSSNGSIASEAVWNDGSNGGATGGGYSGHFVKPSYQSMLTSHYRGVPDVAGNADPYSGYITITDGQQGVVGGTSAVAPLMSALLALCSDDLAHLSGFVLPIFYKNESAFHDITVGNNGHFHAGPGWDACSGLGSPNGAKILASLKG